jgi:LPS-assembly protein
VTAGRSADFTFTPGYFFGGVRRGDPSDPPVFISEGRPFLTPWRGSGSEAIPDPFVQPFGVVGPRLLTEFRYVLSERATGRISLGLLYDLRGRRDPGNPSLMTLGERGLRGEASLLHLQDFGGGFGTRVDLGAYSDGYYQRDVTVDLIARENGYLRSVASVFHRGADHLLTLDAVVRQDLTTGYDLFGRDVFPRGSTAPRYGPNTLQRLPALTFSIPLRPLAGPLAFDFTADLVQQMPLRFGTGDEGVLANEGRFFDAFTGAELPAECMVERLYLARAPSSLAQCPPSATGLRGTGDGRWQPGEREARTRLGVMPRLWAGGFLFDTAGWSASAGYRQGLWVGWSSGRVMTRGYPLLTGRLETQLVRQFGALRHELTPLLELRARSIAPRWPSAL